MIERTKGQELDAALLQKGGAGGGEWKQKEFDVMVFQKSPAIMSSTSSSETPSLFRITLLKKCRIKRENNSACSIYNVCNFNWKAFAI